MLKLLIYLHLFTNYWKLWNHYRLIAEERKSVFCGIVNDLVKIVIGNYYIAESCFTSLYLKIYNGNTPIKIL